MNLLILFYLMQPLWAQMNENEVRGLADRFVQHFSPEVERSGGKLTYSLDWSNTRVNVNTGRWGSEWRIHIQGGYPRQKLLTKDGFVLTLCHELGHHLGGAPLDPKFPYPVSIEGQADFYASRTCLPEYWETEDNRTAVLALKVPAKLSEACARTPDEYLCQRIGMAALSVTSASAARSLPVKYPRFETPDQTRVPTTVFTHGSPQCRLDTHFQAVIGGARPACWFAAVRGSD